MNSKDWSRDNSFFRDLESRLEDARQMGMIMFPNTENSTAGCVLLFGRKGFAIGLLDPSLPSGLAFIEKFDSFRELQEWVYNGPTKGREYELQT